MGRIFISYRRDDSADTCGRIYDRLVRHFGRANIFKDVDSIPYGANFAAFIDGQLKDSAVVLAVIGPQWAGATYASGHRRLDDPGDFVRLEIETALRQGIPVLPVLVHGATMPGANVLPQSLQQLALSNAIQVRQDPDFDVDVRRLFSVLERWVRPLTSAALLSGGLFARGPAQSRSSSANAPRPPLRWGVAFRHGIIAGLVLLILVLLGAGSGCGGSDCTAFWVLQNTMYPSLWFLAALLTSRKTGRVSLGIVSGILAYIVGIVGGGIVNLTLFTGTHSGADVQLGVIVLSFWPLIVWGGAALGRRLYWVPKPLSVPATSTGGQSGPSAGTTTSQE